MKKNVISFLFMLLIGHWVLAQSKTTKMLMATWVDTRIVNRIGKQTLTTILQADSVRAYLLNSEDTLQKPNSHFGEVAILRQGPRLTYRQIRSFQQLVGESRAYHFTGPIQQCAFTPVVGLECFLGKQSIKVLVCLTCDEWAFVGTSPIRKSSFAKQRVLLLALIQQLFPKENFR